MDQGAGKHAGGREPRNLGMRPWIRASAGLTAAGPRPLPARDLSLLPAHIQHSQVPGLHTCAPAFTGEGVEKAAD